MSSVLSPDIDNNSYDVDLLFIPSPLRDLVLTNRESLAPFLGSDDRPQACFNCSRVQLDDRVDSTMILGEKRIYLIDHSGLNESG